MCISWQRAVAGLLMVGLVAAWSEAGGAGVKSDSKVKVAIKSTKAGDEETVVVTLTIDKGWHIYANPVGLEDLASSQTVLTIEGNPKPEGVKIDYPAGKLVKDAVVGDHKVYEEEVVIKAQVRRADAGPLTVAVKFQACNDKQCLLAATVKKVIK